MKAPEKFKIGKLARFKHPDCEWLKYHYIDLDKTSCEIAVEIDAHSSTVSKWLKANGIKKVRQYEDIDWLKHQYITLDKSLREIAAECNVSTEPITERLRAAEISKPKERLAQRHSERMTGEGNPAWNGGTARNYQVGLLKRSGKPHYCIWCGTIKRLQVHHMDHDTQNGDIDNLEWLCGPCNRMEAQIHALVSKGRATVLRENNRISITFTEVKK